MAKLTGIITTPSSHKHSESVQNMGGVYQQLENATQSCETIQHLTSQDTLPIRIKMLLGDLDTISESKKKAGIPSNNEKSRYNKERYKFSLFAPFDISNKCCLTLKKGPLHAYEKKTGMKPITAQTAAESKLRTTVWLHNGCNGFDLKSPISNPMSFWTEQDVLLYIQENNLPIASVYGEIAIDYAADGQTEGQIDLSQLGLFELNRPTLRTTGMNRTGCFACLFGAHLEKTDSKNRFASMQRFSNPKLADWVLRGGEFRSSDGKWHPRNGLGYWFVMEWCNKYGNMRYQYPNREHYVKEYSTPETDYWLKGDGLNAEEMIAKLLGK